MASPWLAILAVLRRGGPVVIKQLPKLWPLLLEQKNRDTLVAALRNAASRSPDRRLRGRVDGTVAVARDKAERARTDDEREVAQSWIRRGEDLAAQLDIPAGSREARANRRSRLSGQLDRLQEEMESRLSRDS